MNLYQHDIEPQFNWWYIVIPVMTVILLKVALKQFRYGRHGKIVMTYGNLVLMVGAAIWSTVSLVLLWTESRWGVLQIFYNGLRFNEAPELAEGFAWAFFTVGIPFLGVLMYFLAKCFAWAKYGYLWEKRAEYRRRIRDQRAAEWAEDHLCQKQRERVTKRVPEIKWIIDETTRTGTDDGKIVPFPNERQNPRV